MLTEIKKNDTINTIKSIFLCRRSIMVSVKQQIATISCCTFLLIEPAHAGIPVFDWLESVPLFSQITATTKSLNNVKSQISQLKETLTAIGDKVNTISKFTTDLSKINADIKSLTVHVTKTIDDAANIGGSVQDKINSALDNVTSKQNDLTKQLTTQINSKINQTAFSNNNFLGDKGKIKLPLKDKDLPLSIEEEEEEEEINDDSEDISEIFALFKKESERLTEELNDILEDAIYVLNQSTDISHKQLLLLQETLLKQDTDIDTAQKEKLEKKLADLIIHEQKVSDWGADIIESIKNRYNREYQTKLVDGFNNYERIVQAYLEKNATKEELDQAENKLKKDVSSINVMPDENTIKSYKEEWQMVRKEMAELSAEIENTVANKEKDS